MQPGALKAQQKRLLLRNTAERLLPLAARLGTGSLAGRHRRVQKGCLGDKALQQLQETVRLALAEEARQVALQHSDQSAEPAG